jgi:hypothetical protein
MSNGHANRSGIPELIDRWRQQPKLAFARLGPFRATAFISIKKALNYKRLSGDGIGLEHGWRGQGIIAGLWLRLAAMSPLDHLKGSTGVEPFNKM